MEVTKGLLRKLTAEFICTFIFIFVVCGSAIDATRTSSQSALRSGIVTALVSTALIYTFGAVSGAHFNPAVTLGAVIAKQIDIIRALMYVGVQLLASTLAVMVLSSIQLGNGAVSNNLLVKPAIGISAFQAIAMEFLLTFILVYVIYGVGWGIIYSMTNEDKDQQLDQMDQSQEIKQRLNFAPIAIGFTLGFLCFVGGSVSGGAFNPARVMGPAIVALNFDYAWIYWVGDILGAAAATGLFGIVYRMHSGTQQS